EEVETDDAKYALGGVEDELVLGENSKHAAQTGEHLVVVVGADADVVDVEGQPALRQKLVEDDGHAVMACRRSLLDPKWHNAVLVSTTVGCSKGGKGTGGLVEGNLVKEGLQVEARFDAKARHLLDEGVDVRQRGLGRDGDGVDVAIVDHHAVA